VCAVGGTRKKIRKIIFTLDFFQKNRTNVNGEFVARKTTIKFFPRFILVDENLNFVLQNLCKMFFLNLRITSF